MEKKAPFRYGSTGCRRNPCADCVFWKWKRKGYGKDWIYYVRQHDGKRMEWHALSGSKVCL